MSDSHTPQRSPEHPRAVYLNPSSAGFARSYGAPALTAYFCLLQNPLLGGGKYHFLSALHSPRLTSASSIPTAKCSWKVPFCTTIRQQLWVLQVQRTFGSQRKKSPLHHVLSPCTKPKGASLPDIPATSLFCNSSAWFLRALTTLGLTLQLLGDLNKAQPDTCKQVYSSENLPSSYVSVCQQLSPP